MTMASGMLWRIWDIAREVLGDNVYERYAQSARRRGENPLPPKEFYLAQLQQKYSRPSRCC
ncbi:MAG: putative selenoprotein [Acidobacteria bacterium]|nr:putative selenoprotein [Acidobacteriota bacterium]